MNKQRTTFNASDVYQLFVKQLLAENPEYWAGRSSYRQPYAFVYKKQGNEVVTVMSRKKWMTIVKTYYLLARKKVINGERLVLGHRLGAVCARTISRNFKNKQINFNETRKQPMVLDPVTGKMHREKIIYFTEDEYSRVKWERLGSITNERMYKFSPCKGRSAGKGFTGEFSTANKQDKLLARKYKQFTDELPID